jgi:uncharacterized protein with HEPN domain
MRPREDEALLRDMLDYARKAVSAVGRRSRPDLETDALLAAAVERFVEVVGEAATKVSEPEQRANPDIPWRDIIGMRNRLVHGYGSVDHDILWAVATQDLPDLVRQIEKALGR